MILTPINSKIENAIQRAYWSAQISNVLPPQYPISGIMQCNIPKYIADLNASELIVFGRFEPRPMDTAKASMLNAIAKIITSTI